MAASTVEMLGRIAEPLTVTAISSVMRHESTQLCSVIESMVSSTSVNVPLSDFTGGLASSPALPTPTTSWSRPCRPVC